MVKNTRWFCIVLVCIAAMALGSGCSKQAKKERYLKQANRDFDGKDFKKAEVGYLNALRLEPTNAVAVTRLATIYYDQGKFDRAARFLYGASALDKENAEVRTRLAQIHLSGGQFQAARTNVLYVLDRSPTNDDALILLSDTAFTPKEIADTQQRLHKLEAQAGNRASWHLAMANLYLRQTNPQAVEGALRKALSLEPNSSRVQIAWGNFYSQQGDPKKAGQAFQKAAELDPDKPTASLHWANFKLTTGAAKEAGEILRQITQKNPDYIPAWTYLARVDFDVKNFQDCSNIIHKVLLQDQGNYQARLLEAQLKREAGQAADAITELNELKRFYKGSAEVDFELALAYLGIQDRPKAAASLQEALRLNPNHAQATLILAELNLQKGDAASAVSPLQNLVKRQPNLASAQFLLGSAYIAQKRFDDAFALYSAMEKEFPTNPAVPYVTGLALRQQGRNVEARAAFQKTLAMAPNDLIVASQLVDLDLLEKNYAAASQRVEALLANTPRSAGAKFIEARIFVAQTNLMAAEAVLQKAIEWEPNYAAAYDLLTRIYVMSNKLPEALQKLQQMLDRNPKNTGVLMEMAMIYDQKGDADNAAKKYRELLKIAPQFTPALNNLAYLLAEKLGGLDEAYAAATRAREIDPQEPRIGDTLGWIDFRRHDYGRALILIEESAAKLSDQAEVQFHLAMAQYMMDQEQPARTAFQRALELKQDFPGSAEAQKRLAILNLDPNATDPATITKLQDQVRQQPDDLPALLRLGKCYERTGAPDKARRAYEEARKANPNSAPALVSMAQLYSTSLKDPKQALLLAREARKLAPDDAEIAHLLGRLADQSGDHQAASSLLQESAQKLPNNPEILFDLAHAFYAIGRVSEAEETMRGALNTGTPLATAQEAQSFLALIALGKTPDKRLESEPQVQQLLKARPDYLPVLMVSGLIHEQRGRITEAKQAYEKILEQSPLFAPARKQLAGLYTDQLGDQQKALEYATKARETLADDPELALTLGKIAYRRNDYRNAVRFLQESSLKRPDDAELFYFLGMAQSKLKNKAESKRALDRAVELNPSAPFVPEVKRVLAELSK